MRIDIRMSKYSKKIFFELIRIECQSTVPLITSVLRSSSIFGSLPAKESNCWYLSFGSGTIENCLTIFSSSGVNDKDDPAIREEMHPLRTLVGLYWPDKDIGKPKVADVDASIAP